MPKFVDHAGWKRQVTAAAADLIAQDGLAGMTFRRLAARLGCSTTAISHYFQSRNELLKAVYDATNAEAGRLRQLAVGTPARTPIESMEDILPVSGSNLRIWRIWLSFWTSALFDAELQDRHRHGIAGSRRQLHEHFLERGFTPDAAMMAAEDVMQAVFGIAMQAVFDQAHWYPGRQLAAYRRAISEIYTAQQTAGTAQHPDPRLHPAAPQPLSAKLSEAG